MGYFIIFVSFVAIFFIGFYLGKEFGYKNFFNGICGVVVSNDLDTNEIIAITYYYSEEAFEEKKNGIPDDWILEEDEMNTNNLEEDKNE